MVDLQFANRLKIADVAQLKGARVSSAFKIIDGGSTSTNERGQGSIHLALSHMRTNLNNVMRSEAPPHTYNYKLDE